MSDNAPAFNPHQSSYRWMILALATTSFTMAFLSRFAWPPLAPAAVTSLNINTAQAMAYMSAFYIGYVATQIPGGILADRFGPKVVLACATLLQGLGTVGIGYIGDYNSGFMLRIVCGLGAGCVYSSCLKAVVTWFAPAQRATAIGVMMTSPTLGIAIPNFLMPILSDSMGMGWQGAFKVCGVILVILAVGIWIGMKDVKVTAAGPRKSFIVGLKFVCSNWNILMISLAGFTIVWAQIGFGSVANKYMVDMLSFTKVDAGRVMVIYGLIGLAMPTLAGYMSGKFPTHKKGMIIGSHLLLIGLFFAFAQVSSFSMCVVVACGIGIIMAFANPIYSVIIAENAGPEWAATAGGVGNAIFQIGAILSPLFIGMARDGSGHYDWTWWILSAGALAGVIFTALVKNRKPEEVK